MNVVKLLGSPQVEKTGEALVKVAKAVPGKFKISSGVMRSLKTFPGDGIVKDLLPQVKRLAANRNIKLSRLLELQVDSPLMIDTLLFPDYIYKATAKPVTKNVFRRIFAALKGLKGEAVINRLDSEGITQAVDKARTSLFTKYRVIAEAKEMKALLKDTNINISSSVVKDLHIGQTLGELKKAIPSIKEVAEIVDVTVKSGSDGAQFILTPKGEINNVLNRLTNLLQKRRVDINRFRYYDVNHELDKAIENLMGRIKADKDIKAIKATLKGING